MKLTPRQPLDEMRAEHAAVVPAVVVGDLLLQRWGGNDKVAEDLAGPCSRRQGAGQGARQDKAEGRSQEVESPGLRRETQDAAAGRAVPERWGARSRARAGPGPGPRG
eukprot:7229857-Pyramimonas_sp.AAC.1